MKCAFGVIFLVMFCNPMVQAADIFRIRYTRVWNSETSIDEKTFTTDEVRERTDRGCRQSCFDSKWYSVLCIRYAENRNPGVEAVQIYYRHHQSSAVYDYGEAYNFSATPTWTGETIGSDTWTVEFIPDLNVRRILIILESGEKSTDRIADELESGGNQQTLTQLKDTLEEMRTMGKVQCRDKATKRWSPGPNPSDTTGLRSLLVAHQRRPLTTEQILDKIPPGMLHSNINLFETVMERVGRSESVTIKLWSKADPLTREILQILDRSVAMGGSHALSATDIVAQLQEKREIPEIERALDTAIASGDVFRTELWSPGRYTETVANPVNEILKTLNTGERLTTEELVEKLKEKLAPEESPNFYLFKARIQGIEPVDGWTKKKEPETGQGGSQGPPAGGSGQPGTSKRTRTGSPGPEQPAKRT